jgi:hypothetical protein
MDFEKCDVLSTKKSRNPKIRKNRPQVLEFGCNWSLSTMVKCGN